MGQKQSHPVSEQPQVCGADVLLCAGDEFKMVSTLEESEGGLRSSRQEDHHLLRSLCQHAALNNAEGLRTVCGGPAKQHINTLTCVTVCIPG